MNAFDLKRCLSQGLTLLDGATGTFLQEHGLPTGQAPERWVLDQPQALLDLQKAYLEAGSQILYAFTFGANKTKLMRNGVAAEEADSYNERLVSLSLKVKEDFQARHPDRNVWVAGDLAPTGEFLKPAGTMSFAKLIEIYRQQVIAQLEAGVDLFVIETMYDLAQARAAVLAIRDECDRPIIVSMTLEEHGRTLSGNLPEDCLLALGSLGIDAFGLNCSHGPEKLLQWLSPLRAISPLPLLAKPNAGLPQRIGERTVFPMQAEEFAEKMQKCAQAGIQLLGGCCGTTPEHLASLAKALQDRSPLLARPKQWPRIVCSARQSWQVEGSKLAALPLITPEDADAFLMEGLDACDDDPDALRVDLKGMPTADHADFPSYVEALEELQSMIKPPLIFEGKACQPGAMKALLRHYHGRAGLWHPGVSDFSDIPGLCLIPRSH